MRGNKGVWNDDRDEAQELARALSLAAPKPGNRLDTAKGAATLLRQIVAGRALDGLDEEVRKILQDFLVQYQLQEMDDGLGVGPEAQGVFSEILSIRGCLGLQWLKDMARPGEALLTVCEVYYRDVWDPEEPMGAQARGSDELHLWLQEKLLTYAENEINVGLSTWNFAHQFAEMGRIMVESTLRHLGPCFRYLVGPQSRRELFSRMNVWPELYGKLDPLGPELVLDLVEEIGDQGAGELIVGHEAGYFASWSNEEVARLLSKAGARAKGRGLQILASRDKNRPALGR